MSARPARGASSDRGDAPDREALAELADLILTIARDLKHTEEVAPAMTPAVTPLSMTEVSVLRYITNHPGVPPSAVADATSLQRPNVSAAVRALVGKGLVARQRDDADRRSVALRPTDLARRELERLRDHWSERLAPAVEAAAPGEIDQTLTALRRIAEGLGHRTEVEEPEEV